MKLDRVRDRESGINITPLIDVVFILLVFFMLAGAIERPDIFEVAPPISDSDVSGDKGPFVVLIGADGEAAIGQVAYDIDEIAELAALRLRFDPYLDIQLKADAGVDAIAVIDLMERLREAGAERLTILTLGKGAA